MRRVSNGAGSAEPPSSPRTIGGLGRRPETVVRRLTSSAGSSGAEVP